MIRAEELRKLYWEEEEDFVSLAAKYGCSCGTVWGWFKKLGIPTRSTKEAAVLKARAVSPSEQALMVVLYETGLSSNDVGLELGRDGRLVRSYLERAGVLRGRKDAIRLAVRHGKIRSVGLTLNESLFTPLTSAGAWVLGLIFGDGHVMNRPDIGRYGIILAGSEEVCLKVAALVNPVLRPKKHSSCNVWTLSWYSREMITGLSVYGLNGGNKARTLRMPSMPSELLGAFLRGLWDADGHWSRRGNCLCTVLVSASEGMVNDLQKILGGRIESGQTVLDGKTFKRFALWLRVEETRSFVDLVYGQSEDRLRCARKYTVATSSAGEGR